MNPLRVSLACFQLAAALVSEARASASDPPAHDAFINFETAPVHPIDFSPDRSRLAVCNLADAKLEIFDVASGSLAPLGNIPVGLDPVTARFRTGSEAWVVNHISRSISVVDLTTMGVTATIQTLD